MAIHESFLCETWGRGMFWQHHFLPWKFPAIWYEPGNKAGFLGTIKAEESVGWLDDILRPPTTHTHIGNGGYCLTCGSDRTVRLWNPHRGLMVKTYKGPGGEVFDADA